MLIIKSHYQKSLKQDVALFSNKKEEILIIAFEFELIA